MFLVSGLFILLTANIDRQTVTLLSWRIAMTTGVILFIARPLAIALATIGAKVRWRERLLVGWIGPRGVVAAAIAGVAGERLAKAGYPDASLVLPLVFAVIASTVILHGLTLAPIARRLGLASGGRSGLLIVGASGFTVALGEALRGAGVPVLLVDRSAEALKAARLAGLQTMRVEVLSIVGEELIDLRDYDHLFAATADDAYNALVCTRFAAELGRVRVYQVAPDNGSGRNAASREWRGKIAVATDMIYQRLSDLMQGGAAFIIEPVADSSHPSTIPKPGWPVALVSATGSLSMFSPEHDDAPSAGDLVVRLGPPALAPVAASVRRRRFGLRKSQVVA